MLAQLSLLSSNYFFLSCLDYRLARAYRDSRLVIKLAAYATGLWLYTVAMVSLFVIWLSITAYKSGQLFRSQLHEGYHNTRLDFIPVSSPLASPLCCLLEDAPRSEVVQHHPVVNIVKSLQWTELRALAKKLGFPAKSKKYVYDFLFAGSFNPVPILNACRELGYIV